MAYAIAHVDGAYDQAYPDLWRFNEWNREFQQFVANGNLPSLEMIRGLSHDHTGSFGSALGGVNTPEIQQADNDYAVGLLVQTVAHSPYASNTLIIVIEDDSQDGADHVDSHRATTYFVGPYVKQHAVVSARYSQPNVLRTIEDILGTEHLNLNTYLCAADGRCVRHQVVRRVDLQCRRIDASEVDNTGTGPEGGRVRLRPPLEANS